MENIKLGKLHQFIQCRFGFFLRKKHFQKLCFAQIPCINAYMWNPENGTDEPICRGGIEKQTCGHSGGRRGREELRERHGPVYTTMHGTGSWCGASVQHGVGGPGSALSRPGGGAGQEGAQEGEDICAHRADSCHFAAEAKTTLESNCNPI